jgi:hypothetical protein
LLAGVVSEADGQSPQFTVDPSSLRRWADGV